MKDFDGMNPNELCEELYQKTESYLSNGVERLEEHAIDLIFDLFVDNDVEIIDEFLNNVEPSMLTDSINYCIYSLARENPSSPMNIIFGRPVSHKLHNFKTFLNKIDSSVLRKWQSWER